MVTEAALRGYLLEESIAWLLRQVGYHLMTVDDADDLELIADGSVLKARGRGADHQADVLGQFQFTAPFSLPTRLFIEAKFRAGRATITTVRNAHGVIHDINQNFHEVPRHGLGPRRRFQYAYALFSTGGFTEDAQRYALAHQLSLVDLS